MTPPKSHQGPDPDKEHNDPHRCPNCDGKMVDGHPAGQDPVRAARAREILEAYMLQTGIEDIPRAVRGLLFDLRHHAGATGRLFEDEDDDARERYDEECEDD